MIEEEQYTPQKDEEEMKPHPIQPE